MKIYRLKEHQNVLISVVMILGLMVLLLPRELKADMESLLSQAQEHLNHAATERRDLSGRSWSHVFTVTAAFNEGNTCDTTPRPPLPSRSATLGTAGLVKITHYATPGKQGDYHVRGQWDYWRDPFYYFGNCSGCMRKWYVTLPDPNPTQSERLSMIIYEIGEEQAQYPLELQIKQTADLIMGASCGPLLAGINVVSVEFSPHNPQATQSGQCTACTSETEQKLVHNWNTSSCGLTNTVRFNLEKPSIVNTIGVWYNTREGGASLSYQLSGPVSMQGTTQNEGCDPYQSQWCEGVFDVRRSFPAGDYVLTTTASAICQNSGSAGNGFITVKGCHGACPEGILGAEDCKAKYNPVLSRVIIPCLDVPDGSGNVGTYYLEMQQQPGTLSFELDLASIRFR
ncbi:hypothetical protein [Thioflexithrix psekupsensis]|uniref:Uncharacterized protein n=1 Tax=Thioflexithrix psekupsensis TaxID=1570016 RepID=A0A251X992_9GAMM|nr:hypothetical protein [Thioflexithrix psekupsensis]OUD14576.1 hypothetical protein TPSD3_09830 [Thioflexithrix psekupsensis]